MTLDGLSLAIYTPLGSGEGVRRRDVGIDADVTGLTWSARLPGGLDRLTIGVRQLPSGQVFAGLPKPVDARHFNHVELWLGSELLADGRVGTTNMPATELSVVGYAAALGDLAFTSSDTTVVSSGALLQTVLASAAPAILPAGDWQDPLTTHAPAEFSGQYPSQILDAIAAEGYADGRLLDWHVRPGLRLVLKPRDASGAPDYILGFDAARMNWQSDPASLAGTVTIEYTGVASGHATPASSDTSVVLIHNLGVTPNADQIVLTPTALPTNNVGTIAATVLGPTSVTIAWQTAGGSSWSFDWAIEVPGATYATSNPLFRTSWGIDIERRVSNAGELTLERATALANTILAQAQTPIASCDLTLGWDEPLPAANGQPRPAHLARLGQVFQVGHEASAPKLVLVAGDWDANARTVRLQLGDWRPSFETLIYKMRRDMQRQMSGLNPTTGGRL